MTHTPTHPHAVHAIRAAMLNPTIGMWAAKRYCEKRGVPMRLYTLARVLEASRVFEEERSRYGH